MTQISGKIFQMTNAAGNENRFPRTVIEAVYGLSSYLQQQFGALADIYMPIEGITETKPLQEFIYRLCPSNIKAKSVSLDRIYGKTLAWNQLVQNGDFVNTSQWSTLSSTLTVVNNEAEVTLSANSGGISQNITYINGHKYYYSMNAKSSVSGRKISITSNSNSLNSNVDITTAYQFISGVFTLAITDSKLNIEGKSAYNWSSGEKFYLKYVRIIDLTLLYGSEIDGMTDAQILAKFESEFPGYHSYSAGKLISNDAESIETVGFNQWDEEWEIVSTQWGNIIFSKNYISVIPNNTYYFHVGSIAESQTMLNGHRNLQVYDSDYNSLSVNENISILSDGKSFVVNSNVHYIKIFLSSGYGTTYKNDICINLSDPAKNGTYEPYRKSTMQLGLNSIKVKSHNIWDEEWEVGNINENTGQDASTNDRIRSKNYSPIIGGATYYAKTQGYNMVVFFYDANYNYLSNATINNNTLVPPTSAAFLRFRMQSTYGTTYNNDICINLSSSFNGQYEPHGILTFNGLKGAGSVYDEIVSNKLVKRVGSVDLGSLEWYRYAYNTDEFYYFRTGVSGGLPAHSVDVAPNIVCGKYVNSAASTTSSLANKNITSYGPTETVLLVRDDSYSDATTFKTAMSGVYAYYELVTPVEYELVSPLVPTVKAGETEARISPNSDGLSAPMVADMTYDAQANNDSASSQYAAVAGRLMNSHTLWGQSFDGTQDVSGAMTGVTTLNASGAATLGSTLNVAGDTTLRGNMYLNNAKVINFKDANSTNRATLYLDSSNQLLFGYGTATAGYNTIIHGNNVSLRYGTSATDGIFLKNNGNVGIGTTSPSQKFHVSGGVALFDVAAASATAIIANSTLVDSTGKHVCINLNTDSSLKAQLGYSTNIGAYFWNGGTTTNKYLIIGNDDTLKYGAYANLYTVYHGGNSNSTSAPWAAEKLGLASESSNWNFNYDEHQIRLIRCTTPVATGAPGAYYGGFSVISHYCGFQMSVYGEAGENTLKFRKVSDNNTWSEWETIAFLSSNVASASKLKTARYLWGNSFDGTANVNGYLQFPNGDLIHAKDSGGTDRYVMGLAGSLSLGYGTASASLDTVIYGNNVKLYYGSSRTLGFTLASDGSTTIAGATTISGNATLSGTLTVGTASANKATTLYGTLNATGNSTLDGTVRIGGSSGVTLEWSSANSGLHFNKGLYSDYYITAGSASASSDAALKKNIRPFFNAIDTLALIKPREWDWNEKTPLEGHCAGFVAQEIQSVMPYAVEKHGEYLSLNYNVFHALEVSALQNHEERIARLEAENAELRKRIGE